MEKILEKSGEKSGNFFSPEKWEPCLRTSEIEKKLFNQKILRTSFISARTKPHMLQSWKC